MRLYFEVGPLKEREYTGIAQVTAALAQEILGDATLDFEFFFGRMIVPRKVVEAMLKTRSGELLEWCLQKMPLRGAPQDLSASNVAVFPNRKTIRRGFARECQIIHDLSTLLTPQFHHQDTIDFHALSMEQDLLTNDATFCVSEATRADVLAYFPTLDPGSVHAMPLSCSIALDAPLPRINVAVESYVLVLGTIEPRKNVAQVLRYLRDNPQFSEKHRVVFIGRFGWGAAIEQLVAQYQLQDQYTRGRVVFSGFVAEHTKVMLLRNARFLIYPSLFEGFGLPVLEAAALGVPCLTTRSSSLPEAGGSNTYYFDPFSPADFARGLSQVLHDVEAQGEELRERCRTWAKQFDWGKTYGILKSRLQELVPAAH